MTTTPGIGYEIVKSLATTRSDFQILLGSRDIRKGEAAAASMGAPVNVNPIQLDITDDQSVDHASKAIEQHFGRLDVLINNAGTAGNDLQRVDGAPNSRATWSHVYNVNVISTALLTDKMIPILEHSKAPKIIFISSDLGSLGLVLKNGKSAAPQVPWYSSSKTALNMLTLHYATQYPSIKVNACNPGLIATGLHKENDESQGDPALGAVNAVRLATEKDGATGTFTETEGPVPW